VETINIRKRGRLTRFISNRGTLTGTRARCRFSSILAVREQRDHYTGTKCPLVTGRGDICIYDVRLIRV